MISEFDATDIKMINNIRDTNGVINQNIMSIAKNETEESEENKIAKIINNNSKMNNSIGSLYQIFNESKPKKKTPKRKHIENEQFQTTKIFLDPKDCIKMFASSLNFVTESFKILRQRLTVRII